MDGLTRLRGRSLSAICDKTLILSNRAKCEQTPRGETGHRSCCGSGGGGEPTSRNPRPAALDVVVVANGMRSSVVILSDLIAIGSRRWQARVNHTREERVTACSRSSV